MEKDIDRRVVDYRAADFNRRLDMYMQFPGLRARFLEIDRSEMEVLPGDAFHGTIREKERPANAVLGFGG